MRFLRYNTATIVTVGPFYDATNGVTIETALTITNERISFTVDANDGSAPTLVLDNVTGATSGTSNDLNYITNCDAGLMQLELSAANTNYLGRAFLTITDAANHCPVFHEFMILPAVVFDAMVAGTDLFDVSMTQILGTAVSTPATAGILDINLKNIANAAVSTSTAQLGVNLVNIAGSVVSTSTAQLGVNAVQAAGTAWGSGAITANSIAASALNGKGDWNIGKTGYTLTATTGLGNQTANITGNLSGSVGSVTGAVTVGTNNDKTGYSLTATTGLGNQTANITGNLSGSVGSVTGAVGSVTGAVGSVTGNVGGNVTGSVGSVTGAVGSVTGNVGGNVVGSVGSVASGGITAASVATDAIDADALAADAVTEINTAVLAAISGIGTAGGASINVDTATDNVLGGISGVTSATTFLGTQSSGTYASTSNVNSIYHVITGTASGNTAMDVVYQFLTGAGTSVVQATWVGYVTGTNDTISVSAWRHDTNGWELLTTIVGTASSTTIQTKNITLFSRHRGTSTAELGKVYLRLHCTGMTTPVVGTDQIIVSYAISSRGTYSDGAVWLNTNASNTNTQSYVDGLPENPVSTIAAAITIATNLNLKRYRVANGSSITLAASHTNRTMLGHGYTLALGTQDISGSYFEGVEGISGTATCPSAEAIFVDCHLNAVTIGEADFVRCHLMNTVTLSQASVPYRFHDCTGITGSKITFSAASQSAVISRVSGVLTIAGMVSTNTLYLDGDADVTFDNTNNTGTVYIAGNIRLTNNGVTMNITDAARWSEDQSVASVTGSVGSLATQAKADVNAEVVDVLRTDTLPDSYSAHEAQPTIAQAILTIHQFLMEREVSGTSVTVQKPDGTTTALTLTLNDGTNPTTVHRSA